jgi:exodeoxyribonuclease VII small subunit
MNDTNLDPNSFDQAYARLKKNADFLSDQQEPSIDQLLPLVEESMLAYNICKTRLEAIRQALEQQLGFDSEPVDDHQASPERQEKPAHKPLDIDSFEDGIPF